jgi:hypothetical protein
MALGQNQNRPAARFPTRKKSNCQEKNPKRKKNLDARKKISVRAPKTFSSALFLPLPLSLRLRALKFRPNLQPVHPYIRFEYSEFLAVLKFMAS